MGGLSSEQQHIERINNAAAALLPQVRHHAGPAVHQLTETFVQVVELSLMADFRYREAERVEALGLNEGRAADARRTADRYNKAALELLTDIMPESIKEVRKEFGHDHKVDARRPLSVFEETIRDQIAAADFKGDHAAVGGRLLHSTMERANKSGIHGLCEHLEEHVERFAELRRHRPEHNEPVSAFIGAVCIIVGAVTMIVCAVRGGSRGCQDSTAHIVAFCFFIVGGLVILDSVSGGAVAGGVAEGAPLA